MYKVLRGLQVSIVYFRPNELTEYLFFGLFLGLSNFFPLRWLLSSFNAYLSLSNPSDRVLLLIKSEGPFEVLSDFRLSKKTDERSILKKARWAFQLGLLKTPQFKMKADIYGIAAPIVNLYVGDYCLKGCKTYGHFLITTHLLKGI